MLFFQSLGISLRQLSHKRDCLKLVGADKSKSLLRKKILRVIVGSPILFAALSFQLPGSPKSVQSSLLFTISSIKFALCEKTRKIY